jgi:hypothetical protein
MRGRAARSTASSVRSVTSSDADRDRQRPSARRASCWRWHAHCKRSRRISQRMRHHRGEKMIGGCATRRHLRRRAGQCALPRCSWRSPTLPSQARGPLSTVSCSASLDIPVSHGVRILTKPSSHVAGRRCQISAPPTTERLIVTRRSQVRVPSLPDTAPRPQPPALLINEFRRTPSQSRAGMSSIDASGARCAASKRR